MKKILKKDLSEKLLQARYAVRGKILIRANEIKEELKEKKGNFKFDQITYCNIGNPQKLMQAPLTFVRNVLALCDSPQLLKSEHVSKIFNEEEIARAKMIVEKSGFQTGGYTHSQGLDFIRKHVAEFIHARDKVGEPAIDRIFLTDGASTGIQSVLFALLRSSGKDAILTPVPQYPLYSASIALFGGEILSYYLNEELNRALEKGKKEGFTTRAMVVINPGNPTGQVFDESVMKMICQFCADNSLVLLADEVYQENIYDESLQWKSFKSVAHSMGKKIEENLQLVSFHSVSKGFFGECGRRGGYMEFSQSFDKEVIGQMYKRSSINLCPNLSGQIVVECLVNRPKKGSPSHKIFEDEKEAILSSLKLRSELLCKALTEMPNMSCVKTKGAMYAFPQIVIPEKAVAKAKEMGVEPDLLYCLELLEKTGICVVPGSGFKQRENTFHFRTTFLPKMKFMKEVIAKLKEFHLSFMKKYQ